jgi:hypothetical protein
MNPRILEYADGNLIILAETMMIPELKVFVDKYGEEGAKPYLAYCYLMTSLDSPYRNLEETERSEMAIYDVINTVGDFDINDPDIEIAIAKLNKLFTTPLMLFFEEIENELYRMRNYLRNTEITGGKDGDLSERFRILKEAGAISNSYKRAQISALEEIRAKARGKGKIGDY